MLGAQGEWLSLCPQRRLQLEFCASAFKKPIINRAFRKSAFRKPVPRNSPHTKESCGQCTKIATVDLCVLPLSGRASRETRAG